MIIFDYGHTLVYEDRWDGAKGEKAVLEFALTNKNDLSAEQVSAFADDLYRNALSGRNIEFHQHKFQQFVYEYLQIEIGLNPEEIERLYWDAAAPAHAMPYIKQTLAYLHANGIRTGVISNISFSGETLKNRINDVLPDNNFEFFIASSEYIFRKPSPYIFKLALVKAGLRADETWYCGDSAEFDVEGADSAGIFPVWYESEIECWYRERGRIPAPGCEHLHIRDWRELTELISKI